ncbi:MAG: dihydropteroate synthase [Gammaproteobacteria bacterium]|nr:dihydropteroate synthase [Gammaproteobacteria bacterium]
MSEHIVFVTGKLAEPILARVLREMAPAQFSYEIRQLGISVAALMTVDFIRRRLGALAGVDRVLVPGRCRGDLDVLTRELGVPFARGPAELKDLPAYLGGAARTHDLSRHDVLIFAEIVDAPQLGVDAILARAAGYRADGADVIDLGCLPDTPFPHLTEAVHALKREGYAVSVDSLEATDLLAGGRAGADYLLSLTEDTLWIADEVAATAVLIGRSPQDEASLDRAIDGMRARGRAFFADAILDPVHMGFTASVARYERLRRRHPEAAILMGTGNLTELTHADTAGITALLMGIVSELGIGAILTTQVSPHCRRAVKEADLARRIMYAARADHSPPQHVDDGLIALHERHPWTWTAAEVAEQTRAVRDANYRIQVTPEGVHLYNRDGHYTATDPYALFPRLRVDGDHGHAFYLGLELARAQIAWQLGKRYSQDEELDWGCAVDRPEPVLEVFAPARTTLHARRAARKRRRKGD